MQEFPVKSHDQDSLALICMSSRRPWPACNNMLLQQSPVGTWDIQMIRLSIPPLWTVLLVHAAPYFDGVCIYRGFQQGIFLSQESFHTQIDFKE